MAANRQDMTEYSAYKIRTAPNQQGAAYHAWILLIGTLSIGVTLALVLFRSPHHSATGETNTDLAMLITAAEKGSTDAQTKLGKRYLDGNGLAKDNAKAVFWF